MTILGDSSGSLGDESFGGKELIMIVLATALIILALFMLFSGEDEDYKDTNTSSASDQLPENEVKDAILVIPDDAKETENSS